MDRRALIALLVLASGSACNGTVENKTAGSGGIGGISCGYGVEFSSDEFIRLRDDYFLRTLRLNPVTSTYLGGSAYSPELKDSDGRLREYSQNSLDAERKFYESVKSQLQAIDPSTLPADLRIDYDLMTAQVTFLIHQDDRKYYQRAVDTYVVEPFRGIDWQLQGLTDAGEGLLGSEDEWKLVVARLKAIPHYLDVARTNLAAGKASGNLPDRRMVQRDGIDGAAADAEYFRNSLQKSAASDMGTRAFASSMLPQLKEAGEGAAAAIEAFAVFLKSMYDLSEAADRFAAGTPEYEWRVHTLFRDARSAEQLYAYGAEQVTLYEGQMEEVAQRIAEAAKLKLPFDAPANKASSVRAVFRYLSNDSPANDEQLFQWYRETAVRAVAYGRETGMFDIPSNYKLDVVPTPQVLRGSVDAAYYPAPPLKKTGVGRFYLSPTGNDPGALKLNNRASIADTAVHEGFPGHDWHFKYMTQHSQELSNIRWLTPGAVEDSSAMWSDSMATEGWGLYAEELMAQPLPEARYGFYTPAEYLYELQGQMLRAVRVRVDVGIHTGRMTFDEARDYFTEHVDFYPHACSTATPLAKASCETADRAIYRYSKWPTQAITYNLGKSAIVRVRETYRQKAGPAYSARTFHEKLMRMGQVPATYFGDAW